MNLPEAATASVRPVMVKFHKRYINYGSCQYIQHTLCLLTPCQPFVMIPLPTILHSLPRYAVQSRVDPRLHVCLYPSKKGLHTYRAEPSRERGRSMTRLRPRSQHITKRRITPQTIPYQPVK